MFPERLSFPSLRTPESFPRGFSLRVSALPKVSRLCLLKSRDFCCLSILYGLAVFVRRHISIFIFHRTPARKSPERLSSPSQRTPESFPTLPPEISRFLLPLDISTASRSSPGAISPFSSVARPKVSREAFLSESASSRKFLDYAT